MAAVGKQDFDPSITRTIGGRQMVRHFIGATQIKAAFASQSHVDGRSYCIDFYCKELAFTVTNLISPSLKNIPSKFRILEVDLGCETGRLEKRNGSQYLSPGDLSSRRVRLGDETVR